MTNAYEPAGLCTTENGYVGQYEGLSKLEHFAGLAMQGLLSSMGTGHNVMDYDDLSADAVMAAKALINTLNNNP